MQMKETAQKNGTRHSLIPFLAEREGFKPPERQAVHRISSPAQSVTLAPFLKNHAKLVHFF